MSVNKQFYSETLFGFVFGIEIADQVHFKNHLMIQQSDTAVKSILNTKGVNPEVKKWIDKTDLLDIALGIVPGEAVQYRTYIGFAHPLAAKDLLIKKLGKVGEAMSMCHNTGLAWKDETTSDPYIYLERPDLRPVFSLLKLKIEHDRLVRYGRDPYIFGTVLSDLKARKLKGFNTYYQMK
jgi:hypothetical protein